MSNPGAKHLFGKDFCIMVVGQIITVFGTSLLRFGLSLFILDSTGREDIYATLYAVSSIPLLFSPVGGAIIDRFDRKRIMVLIDAANGIIVLSAVLLFSAGTTLSTLGIGAVMFFLGMAGAVEFPNTMAALPSIVHTEELERANGVISSVQMLSTVIAPVMGGMLYTVLGFKALLVTSCGAFFLAAALECFIHIPYVKRTLQLPLTTTIIQDLKTGLAYVLKQSFIRKGMILAALLNLILTPLFAIGTPIILRIALKSSDIAFGIGMGIIHIATILGALTIGKISKIIKMNQLYLWIFIIAILIIPIAISVIPVNAGYYSTFVMFFAGAVPISMILAILSIIILARVQKQTPDDLMGKVMAITTAASQCMTPVGQALYGVLFRTFNSALYIPLVCISMATVLLAVITKLSLGNEKE